VKVQISPNNTDWIDDGTAVTVDAGALVTLVPSVFLKYVRLAAIATTTSATLTAFIQGQK
jgi:VIT1/CCC1 family predicted Fe2+/Mn2+ transporter